MRIWLMAGLCLVVSFVAAQGTLNYTFTLKDGRGSGMAGVQIKFTNAANGKVTTETTDGTGKVTHSFSSSEGTVFTLSYLDHENEVTLNVPENGIRTGSKSLTYVSKQAQLAELPADRSDKEFTVAADGNATAIVRLMDENRRSVSQKATVVLVDVPNSKKYLAKSSSNGEFSFRVPAGNSYEIDIDGITCLAKMRVDETSSEASKGVAYVKSNVQETRNGDTIFQVNPETCNRSTDRVAYTLNLSDYGDRPLNGEWVYLKGTTSKRIYAGKTDDQGKLFLQLPKSENFVINLKHENNLREVTCKRSQRGFAEASTSFSNQGYKAYVAEIKAEEERKKQAAIAELQRQKVAAEQQAINAQMRKVEEAKRKERESAPYNPSNYRTDFRNTPIQAVIPVTIKVQKTAKGYVCSSTSDSEVGTPIVTGNKVIASSGFNTNEIYCFDNDLGKVDWQVRLAEGGPSALVYSGGVVLVYTESCTLYALDANSGKLLWSKYLTSYVYSTPSVYGNKVLAVYRDNSNSQHVLICMDLKSGTIQWQRPTSGECLGAPILTANRAYVTTHDGVLDIFDLEKGSALKRMKINAISCATVIGSNFYVSIDKGGKETLAKFKCDDFGWQKEYGILDGINELANLGVREKMTAQGSRVFGYKGLGYIIDGARLMCFDPMTEKVEWTNAVADHADCQMQPVALEGIIAAASDKKVTFFEYKKGAKLYEYDLGSTITTTPVIANNTIYAGCKEGKLVIHKMDKVVKNYGTMWGGNASHNLNID